MAKQKMESESINGNNGTDNGVYVFETFQSDSKRDEEIDFKKEAVKIYAFICDHISGGTRSEIKKIYKKVLQPVSNIFVTTMKTEKDCTFCTSKIEINEIAYFERVFQPHKHFKIMHPFCALKCWTLRFKENIEANAPQVILNDFCEVIGNIHSKILKEVIKNKQDITPYIINR